MTKRSASSIDSRRARAEVRFRQLGGLGIGGLVAAPTVLNELQRVVPGSSAAIFHERPGQRMGIFREPAPMASAAGEPNKPAHLDAAGHDHSANHAFRYFVDSGASGTSHRAGSADEEAGPMLERLFKGAQAPEACIRLRMPDEGGYICMVGAHVRDAAEIQTLRRLKPFIQDALTPRKAAGVAEVESGHSALLVVDASGRAHWMSAGARTLLALALDSASTVLPAGVMRIVQVLLNIRRADAVSTMMASRCRSRWGQFEFRAYRLNSVGQDAALAGLTLSCLVPLPLRLFEVLGNLEIAPRQAQVALRLGLGNTQDQVANQLGLSRATVVYHRRQIYNRLGVDTRDQMLHRLLKAP